jgi:hypothetical protein
VGDLEWGLGDTKDFGGIGVAGGMIGGAMGDLEWYLRGAFRGVEILAMLGAWAAFPTACWAGTFGSVRRWLG